MYKLDRNSFKVQTTYQASSFADYWKKQTAEDLLKAAIYLNSIAFDFDLSNPPGMDKKFYSDRKHTG